MTWANVCHIVAYMERLMCLLLLKDAHRITSRWKNVKPFTLGVQLTP